MSEKSFFKPKQTLNLRGKLFQLTEPCVMGIINITPDSFYSNSRISDIEAALKKTEQYLEEGATFIDIGAYSSRPGAIDVSEEEELRRLIPVVEAIGNTYPEAILSIDTFRARVAKETVDAGAHLINDISAGQLDENLFKTVADLKVPYILMHMKGTPQNMQHNPVYENFGMEVITYFDQKVQELRRLGVADIIIDPGFGFAKTLDHNYQLLHNLENLHIFELPILVGFSRKSMIYNLLNITPQDALNGTSVLNTIALLKGAGILRVHDVKEAKECILLTEKIRNS